jgi:Protein of unknown function (DUF5674)
VRVENHEVVGITAMIQILDDRATPAQMQAMLEALGIYVKLVVDLDRRILAGGGELHADCEKVLLRNGSRQADLWGADWYPFDQTIGYESIINIRESANNRSMEIQDPIIRSQIDEIIYQFLGGVPWQSTGTV